MQTMHIAEGNHKERRQGGRREKGDTSTTIPVFHHLHCQGRAFLNMSTPSDRRRRPQRSKEGRVASNDDRSLMITDDSWLTIQHAPSFDNVELGPHPNQPYWHLQGHL